MGTFQIRSDINMIDADERGFERHFASDDRAQLTLHQFVYAQKAMFHFSL